MAENLTAVLEWYKSSQGQEVPVMETQILKTVQEAQVWNTLNDLEKQAKRKEWIRFNKLKFPEDQKRSIAYEEKVVALIDAISVFVQSTEKDFGGIMVSRGTDEPLLFRLRVMMICEKELANRLPKIQNVGHVPWIIVQPLFESLQTTPFYKRYDLQTLNDLYLAMTEAHSQSPYSK